MPGADARDRRLRTPRADRRPSLVEPPLATTGELVQANRTRLTAAQYDLHGRDFGELRQQARRELLMPWREYANLSRAQRGQPVARWRRCCWRAISPSCSTWRVGQEFCPLTLARQHRGTAVNLVIDSDTLKRRPCGCRRARLRNLWSR